MCGNGGGRGQHACVGAAAAAVAKGNRDISANSYDIYRMDIELLTGTESFRIIFSYMLSLVQ